MVGGERASGLSQPCPLPMATGGDPVWLVFGRAQNKCFQVPCKQKKLKTGKYKLPTLSLHGTTYTKRMFLFSETTAI